MTKLISKISITLVMVTLLGGCSSVRGPADGPIVHQGTGNVVEYHANGKIKREAEYLDGELVTVVTYYASGTEESNEHYELGHIHDATYYFADGRTKTEISSE